jgi:hypothetical protein
MTGCEKSGTTVGMVVEHEGWIYFTNTKEGALYRMKLDLSDKMKVTDMADYVIFQDDNIFFMDGERGISKINVDGSDLTKITDAAGDSMFGFQISDGWIYFTTKAGELSKVRTGGSEQIKVTQFPSSFNGDFRIFDDWIYYAEGSSLSKMKIDGSAAVKLSDNAGIYQVFDEIIYYGEVTDKGEFKDVYRMKSDGTAILKMVEGAFVSVDEDRLYYSNDQKLYSSDLYGKDEKLILEEKMWTILGIYDDHLYFGEYSGAAYKINLDGSNKLRIE